MSSDDLLNLFSQLDDSTEERATWVRAPLNYPGSKYSSLDNIMPHLPYHGSFCDVFGGTATVLLNRRKEKFEVFNDRHSGIIAFYRCLQDPEKIDRLIDTIELMPHSRELFYRYQNEWDAPQDDVLRAAMWYYMVQASFVGRSDCFGRDKKFRNSIWRKIHGNFPLFGSVHNRLKGVLIENLSWKQIFKDFDDVNMVFYCDPPYIDSNIYKYKMSKADHKLMCDTIFSLEAHVVLSGYDNEIYNAYPWDHKEEFEVDNRVQTMAFDDNNNMKGKENLTDREDRTECLWVKESK